MLTLIHDGDFKMRNFYFMLVIILWMGSLHSEDFCDWVDIPVGNYHEILGATDIEIEHLNRVVRDYHAIDKSCVESLSARVSGLSLISSYLVQLAEDAKFADKKHTIMLLDKLVKSKRCFLEKLQQMSSDPEIAAYHCDLSGFSDARFTPVFLRNNRSYSLKMKEFWGEFWLESIDPCHRRLANYYQFWLDATSSVSTDYRSFLLWLETQPIPKYIPYVEYYTDAKRDTCHIVPVDGYLTNAGTREKLHTHSKRSIFIVDLEKDLYVEASSESCWHTSLSRGKPVLGAGVIQVEHGVVKTIAFESGHYLPSLQQSFQSIQIFREKGFRFSEPLEVIYFENRNKYKVLIPCCCVDDYEVFNAALHDLSKRLQISSNEF